MPQVPESVEKPFSIFLNLVESTNLASTALYVYEAFHRAADRKDNQLMAEILLVASAVSLAATFWWMVFGHWRTQMQETLHEQHRRYKFQCLLNLCFACGFPLAFGLIIFRGVLTEDPWMPLDIQSMVAAVILTVWAASILLCLGLRVKMHDRFFKSKEEQQSAMMQLPLLGFLLVWKMTPGQLRTVRETTSSYKIVLRIIEDIPETIIAGIDLAVFGGSWFAIFDFVLSTLEILMYLTMPIARLLICILVGIGKCFYNVAKFHLCFQCIKCCIECVDDVAKDPTKSPTDSDAAQTDSHATV